MTTAQKFWSRLDKIAIAVFGPRLQLFALIAGVPVLTMVAAWVISIISKGWPASQAELQLTILANALYGLLALIAVGILAIAAGLIHGVRLSGFGASVDVDLDGNDQP